jgi:hypothetical protein
MTTSSALASNQTFVIIERHTPPQSTTPSQQGGETHPDPFKNANAKTAKNRKKPQKNANKRKWSKLSTLGVSILPKNMFFWIPLTPNHPENIWFARKIFDFDPKMTQKVAVFASFFPKFSADAETAKSKAVFHRGPKNRLPPKNAKNK